MLAHPYKGSEKIGSWYWSQKLDGMRAYWDSGISRGQLVTEVPFANTAKDARYINPPRATGLWSRYGKPIYAPDWWLDKLPKIPLDGELFMGNGQFQKTISTVKTLTPGPDWSDVVYMVFDSPPYRVMFANGEIKNTNFKKVFVNVLSKLKISCDGPPKTEFASVYEWLQTQEQNEVFRVLEQKKLSWNSQTATEEVKYFLDYVIGHCGEGLMLRSPSSYWVPERTRTLLKVKGLLDDEATVTGYVAGRETDKGSKLLGLMGALEVKYKGRIFELSGFTDEERTLIYKNGSSAASFASENPGKRMPDTIYNPKFPIGTVVSFKYRELTDDKVPKEARYWRKYVD
jgi:DNA ligase-1